MKKLLEILKLFHFKFIFSCLTLSLQIIYLFLFFFDYLFSLVIFTPIHLLISSWHLLSMCYPMFLFFSANFLLSEFIEMLTIYQNLVFLSLRRCWLCLFRNLQKFIVVRVLRYFIPFCIGSFLFGLGFLGNFVNCIRGSMMINYAWDLCHLLFIYLEHRIMIVLKLMLDLTLYF